jgi:hypothetical protein
VLQNCARIARVHGSTQVLILVCIMFKQLSIKFHGSVRCHTVPRGSMGEIAAGVIDWRVLE